LETLTGTEVRARVVVGLLALAAITSACASATGAVPKPFPVPGGATPAAAPPAPGARPASSPSSPSRSAKAGRLDAYALTTTALSLRGAPYRNGGADPNGFDCSGFTQYVFAQHGVALPREVRDQYRVGAAVAPRDVSPGDLLFFTTAGSDVSHVAIAIGGDEFVHAPSSTGVVRVERLGASYWSQRFVAAKRLQ